MCEFQTLQIEKDFSRDWIVEVIPHIFTPSSPVGPGRNLEGNFTPLLPCHPFACNVDMHQLFLASYGFCQFLTLLVFAVSVLLCLGEESFCKEQAVFWPTASFLLAS